jgi:hypothetical protein
MKEGKEDGSFIEYTMDKSSFEANWWQTVGVFGTEKLFE